MDSCFVSLNLLLCKRSSEVLFHHLESTTRLNDDTGLTPDARVCIIEEAYAYGCRQATKIDRNTYREIQVSEWLTARLKVIDRKFRFARDRMGRYVWFDSPMVTVCDALHDYIGVNHKQKGAGDVYTYFDMHDALEDAFVCGLAVGSGMTMKDTKWE